jgi:MoxR-like ATPase
MAKTMVFTDPAGSGPDVELPMADVSKDLPDYESRMDHIPTEDPYYVDLGMQYQLAALEKVRTEHFMDSPLHLALRGHMGTGKDHDLEQFAARLKTPYYRIPLTGEVRDITLIGSVKLHGDGKGGTESLWEDGDITRALRGPSLVNLSELNAAGAETLFALHGLLDRHRALELPTGEMVRLRHDVRIFGTLNPTDLRDYAGTQTLNKAFADRWIIWEKTFPSEDDLILMIERRHSDPGGDADVAQNGSRPVPGWVENVRGEGRSDAVGMAGIHPPAHRPVRQGPLRDGVVSRRTQGTKRSALFGLNAPS